MSDTVQQIKDKLSIVDVVSGYVKLERSGSALRARCPFHAERTPSFYVSPDRGTYHCFGCNVGGDIFSFVEAIEGIDFKGALKVLADKAGVKIEYTHGQKTETDERDRLYDALNAATEFFVHNLTLGAREYLKGRGVNDAIMKEFRLGFAGNNWSDAIDALKKKKFTEKEIVDAGIAKRSEQGTLVDKFRNRIMFPLADSAGRIVAFSGRTFGPDAHPDAPKYLNSPETMLFKKSRMLYGFDRAKLEMRKLNCAVLVEGQMDLVMSHQSGWGNTVAVSGTAFTGDHAALIRRMTDNLVIALDADEAGIKAAGRAARAALAAGLNVKVAQLPSGMDPADLIVKEGADAWKNSIKNAKDIITFLLDVLEERVPLKDKFRRMVEAAVLPFLVAVQSPIAREQYVHEIAERLGVSEGAVTEALERVPRDPTEFAPASTGSATHPAAPIADENPLSDRIQKAYAILLWQETLAKAALDVKKYAQELEEAVGPERYTQFTMLRENDRERLKFSAERLYGPEHSPEKDTVHLLRIILRERLSAELVQVSDSLKTAERQGNSDAAESLMERSRILTSRIAKLHEIE